MIVQRLQAQPGLQTGVMQLRDVCRAFWKMLRIFSSGKIIQDALAFVIEEVNLTNNRKGQQRLGKCFDILICNLVALCKGSPKSN